MLGLKFFSIIKQISCTYSKGLTKYCESVLIVRAWHRLASVVLHVSRVSNNCWEFVFMAEE